MTLDVPLGRARQSAFACRHRLVRHLGTLVGPDGALAGRCDSRILESALFLALVRKHGSPGAETARLVRYLRGASATDGWQPLLAAAALGTLTDGGRATAAARLRTFDHFTGARKRALLSTCLALCGVLPYDRRVAAAPCRTPTGWPPGPGSLSSPPASCTPTVPARRRRCPPASSASCGG
ncbi:hypothetical protein ACFQ2B_03125 [Streptomyces stramineus]